MNYNDLLEESLSQESSQEFNITKEYIEIDDEKDGTSIISEDIKRELDKHRINYIVNASKLPHPKQLRNAVVDGVYHEEVDVNKRRNSSQRIKIIYDDTLNVADEVTAYVVPNEETALSMETSGYTVLRTVSDVVAYIKKEK